MEKLTSEQLNELKETTGYDPDSFDTVEEQIEFLENNLKATKIFNQIFRTYLLQIEQINSMELPATFYIRMLKVITAFAIKGILKVEWVFDITHETDIIKMTRYELSERILFLNVIEKNIIY